MDCRRSEVRTLLDKTIIIIIPQFTWVITSCVNRKTTIEMSLASMATVETATATVPTPAAAPHGPAKDRRCDGDEQLPCRDRRRARPEVSVSKCRCASVKKMGRAYRAPKRFCWPIWTEWFLIGISLLVFQAPCYGLRPDTDLNSSNESGSKSISFIFISLQPPCNVAPSTRACILNVPMG